MEPTTIFILLAIGIIADVASGFVGIGGGLIIVPALIYFLGLDQHTAQGTSLALMLPPVGVLAAMQYQSEQHIEWDCCYSIDIYYWSLDRKQVVHEIIPYGSEINLCCIYVLCRYSHGLEII